MRPTPSRPLAVALAALLLLAGVPAPGTAAEETDIERDGDVVTLASGPGQVVAGNTSLPPGTTVSVRVRADGPNPFLMTRSAIVDADGRFRTVFDLSKVAAGAQFEVTVHHDGEALATAPGETTVCRSACDASTPTTASAEFDRDGDLLRVGTGPGQTVGGTTNLPPGTTLTVRVKSAGSSPFIKSREATVGADGRFQVVYDFTDIEVNTSFRALVRYNDSELTSASGEVVECPDCAEPGTGTPASLGVVEVTRGDTAQFSMPVEDAATVTVGEFAGGFTLAATVRDANGDGRVALELETGEDATVRALDGDEANVTVARGAPGATDYRVRLYAGTDVGVGERDDGDRVLAEGSLVVVETGETPTVAFSPERRAPLPLDVAGALAVGGVLGVLGVGLLVGLLRP